MDTERVMERVRRLLAIANDPAASDNEQRIADYHIGDTEEHRALADAIQEQMIYQALCREATTRGKWIER